MPKTKVTESPKSDPAAVIVDREKEQIVRSLRADHLERMDRFVGAIETLGILVGNCDEIPPKDDMYVLFSVLVEEGKAALKDIWADYHGKHERFPELTEGGVE